MSRQKDVRVCRRHLACPKCEFVTRSRYDTRQVPSRWRHLDLGRFRLEVKASLRPEFVNRIDEIVRFRSLSRSDLTEIVDIQLRLLEKRLEDRRLDLEVSKSAKQWLGDHGYDPAFGARPLRRVIQRALGDPLATALLEGRFVEGDTVHVDTDESGESLALK